MFTRRNRLPRNVLDELADELEATRLALLAEAERVAAIVEVERAAAVEASRAGLALTIFDLVDAARGEGDRRRLADLVGRLRRGNTDSSLDSRRYQQ